MPTIRDLPPRSLDHARLASMLAAASNIIHGGEGTYPHKLPTLRREPLFLVPLLCRLSKLLDFGKAENPALRERHIHLGHSQARCCAAGPGISSDGPLV